MKKRTFIIAFIVAIIFGISISAYINHAIQSNQKEYQLSFKFDDGFIAKFKLPEDTQFEKRIGAERIMFKTNLSESELNNYYNNYFSTLKKVKNSNQNLNLTGYYDPQQRLVYSDFEIITENNQTKFTVSFDIYNDEYWILL